MPCRGAVLPRCSDALQVWTRLPSQRMHFFTPTDKPDEVRARKALSKRLRVGVAGSRAERQVSPCTILPLLRCHLLVISHPPRLMSLLSSARTSIDVCVFTITCDEISAALLDAHRRGVRVRVITDNDQAANTGSDIARLRSAGVPVATDADTAHMHHKCVAHA